MSRVEEELRRAREEIRRIATRIALPRSPRLNAPSPKPLQLWRSPAKIHSTSAASAPVAPPPLQGDQFSGVRSGSLPPPLPEGNGGLPSHHQAHHYRLSRCCQRLEQREEEERDLRWDPNSRSAHPHPRPHLHRRPAGTTTPYTYRTFPQEDPHQAQGNQCEHRSPLCSRQKR